MLVPVVERAGGLTAPPHPPVSIEPALAPEWRTDAAALCVPRGWGMIGIARCSTHKAEAGAWV